MTVKRYKTVQILAGNKFGKINGSFWLNIMEMAKPFLDGLDKSINFFFVGASMSIGTVLHSQTIFVWQGYYVWSSSMVDVENLYASRGGLYKFQS